MLAALGSGTTQGQDDTLNVAFYNLLNFPLGGGGIPNRQDTLAIVAQHMQPDVLMVCELADPSARPTILNQSLNIGPITYYQAAPYQNNTSSGDNLQNLIFYNSNKLTLHSTQILATDLRDINKYTLYYNDPNLAATMDTTFIDFYVTHLKASQGGTNQNRRNLEITVLRDHINMNSSLRNSVLGADLNVYTSSEPAYQTITTTGTYPLTDPINTPGSWNNNGTFAAVHTQSTRTTQLGGDGASGGMDDRFDQILVSSNIMSGADRIRYLPGTYRAVGQDGNHFNSNVNSAPPNLSEPANVINALYHMSDHLPVFLRLEVTLPPILPIAVDLKGAREGSYVLLELATADATGNEMLTLERSRNAVDFEAVLRQRALQGVQRRVFEDEVSWDGPAYYRVRIEDPNGGVDYSPTVALSDQAPEGWNMWLTATAGAWYLHTESPVEMEADIEWLSAAGARLQSGLVTIPAGRKIVPLNKQALAAGLYMIRMTDRRSGKSIVRRFVR